jgi:hypothetical protein
MKLSVKHILAVGALAVASASAFADAVVPNGGVISGNSATTPVGDDGGLVFSLFSKNPDTAFSLNNYLGLTLNSIVPTEMDQAGLTLTWHVEGLSNLPGSVAPSDLVWGVTASDNGSLNTNASIRLATTVDVAGGSATSLTNGQIANVTNTWNTTVTPTNNAQNTSPVDFTTTAGSPTDLQQQLNTNDGAAGFSWTAGLSNPLAMYLFTQSGGRGTTNNASTALLYAGTWSFDLATASLTYTVAGGAPVPLPAALWLLLSGLTGIGVIGRRKGTQAAVAA